MAIWVLLKEGQSTRKAALLPASRRFDATVTILKQKSELINLGLLEENEGAQLTRLW